MRETRGACRQMQVLDQRCISVTTNGDGYRHSRARIDSIFASRPLIGSELVFVICSFPFTVTAPRYCSPSTPVDKAGPQIAVSSTSRARVGYGIAPTLDKEPCDAKL